MANAGTLLALGLPRFTAVIPPVNYVDFEGNLGGASAYGRKAYGVGPYARTDAFSLDFGGDISVGHQNNFVGSLVPSVTFTGNIDLLGSDNFDGVITPHVTFAATLTVIKDFSGELAFSIPMTGNVGFDADFVGDLAFSVSFSATFLSIDYDLEGGMHNTMDPLVTFVDATMISEPLWEPTAPCGPVDWEDTELCNG
jgi:hypothetical protein